jgi:hypothetical protein
MPRWGPGRLDRYGDSMVGGAAGCGDRVVDRRAVRADVGEISRYRPPPSNNRMGLSAGLALRIAESLSTILGAS